MSETGGGRILLRGVAPAMGARYEGLDIEDCCEQWASYWEALLRAGREVLVIPSDDALPDCCFVEDTAIVSGGRALVSNLSADWRERESDAVAAYLGSIGLEIVEMSADARLEAGDVLRIGSDAFVGLSSRTNQRGFEAVATFLAADGYTATPVAVDRCLHLQTGVTRVTDDTVLLDPEVMDERIFTRQRVVHVAEGEPGGANVLALGDTVLAPASAPRTQERLRGLGVWVTSIDISELEKADGGLTCLSIRLDDPIVSGDPIVSDTRSSLS